MQTKSIMGTAEPKKEGKLLKNFYTSPAKKGGFGFPTQDRTIGGKVPAYMRDDFEVWPASSGILHAHCAVA